MTGAVMRLYYRTKSGQFARPSIARSVWTQDGNQLYGAAKKAAHAKQKRRPVGRKPPTPQPKPRRAPPATPPIVRDFMEDINHVSGRSVRQVYALVRFDITDAWADERKSPPLTLDEDIETMDDTVLVSEVVAFKLPHNSVAYWRARSDNEIIEIVEAASGDEVAWLVDESGEEHRAYYGLTIKRTQAACKKVGKRLAARRARHAKALKSQGGQIGRVWKNADKTHGPGGKA